MGRRQRKEEKEGGRGHEDGEERPIEEKEAHRIRYSFFTSMHVLFKCLKITHDLVRNHRFVKRLSLSKIQEIAGAERNRCNYHVQSNSYIFCQLPLHIK